MSEMERNKGKLIPVEMDTEHFTEDEWDDLYDNGLVAIDGEVYRVEWEVKHDTEDYSFREVTVNEDGSITFHTYHYNGGAFWTEVVESELKRQDRGKE